MNGFLRWILCLPEQRSSIALELDSLHYFVILTTMVGAVVVTLVGGYYLFRYRRRSTDVTVAYAQAATHPNVVYKLAAIVGLAFLFVIWWVMGFRIYLRIRTPPANAMQVYVTAKQWMWKFAYPEGARSIATLYVPAGQPVELIMTSRDVIHSFYVPEFRIKQDVVPGRYTTIWFTATVPGTYRVLCSQYCGTAHSNMRGEVVALPPAEFQRWLAGQAPKAESILGPVYRDPSLGLAGAAAPRTLLNLVRVGEVVAASKGCFRCHTVDGTPHLGPTWAGLWYSMVPLQGGGKVVADEAYLTESMMDPNAKLHRGYAAIMPSYLGNLSEGDAAAILEFIKSLREVVPPAGASGPVVNEPPGAALGSEAQGQGERGAPRAPEPPGGLLPILDGGANP